LCCPDKQDPGNHALRLLQSNQKEKRKKASPRKKTERKGGREKPKQKEISSSTYRKEK
jgi:hypothetical protein